MSPAELFTLITHSHYNKAGRDVDYLVTEIEGRPALLFQGSASKMDWLVNLSFPRKLYKNQENPMLVHGGYGKAWKEVNDQIIQELQEACKGNEKRPLIAGHSYGGAMSVLAAEDFCYRTGTCPQVVTFGAPMVAGSKKCRNYIATCGDFEQYADPNDMVPICPPLPGFHQINKIAVGDPFNLKEMLTNCQWHHTHYDRPELYQEEGNDSSL